ncbi:hypothetical protein Q5H92_26290 [Hymenobacter sp. M29]|uniref:Uncharacterized protein n=1 Tax=Hymenobacter mellowenesis TaxID=3063995 RepID=A0ABT9AJ51_9BACT|nr:hypothetical protein [Hymenobacter sp. M29]MDO7849897.1 hypothetical protein [Hymenobacter sp. M29]
MLVLLPVAAAHAQIGVGTTTPDAKSALDIRATDKGLLIPRLTATQRTSITNPPQGLMVYQTDGTASGGTQTGFWYYAGTGGWVFIEPAASGLALPYSGTASTSSPAFAVSNTGTGVAISGTGSGTSNAAVQGINNNSATNATGVLGTTAGGYGVRGTASASGGYGIEGRATDSRGVSGFSTSGQGLYGNSTTGVAVQGAKITGDKGRVAQFTSADATNDSTALYVSTAGDRPALRAVNTATSAQAAIRGVKQSASTDGIGVEGVITSGATGNAAGVLGNDHSGSGGSSGVIGLTTNGYGVRGIASASGGYGVSGSATNSFGVIGASASGVGTYGSSTSSYGVQGTSTSGSGVYGSSTSSYGVQASAGNVAAVYGTASPGTSGAIVGINNSTGGTTAAGVLGLAQDGWGVRGVALTTGMGVSGQSPDSYGVSGVSGTGSGVYGRTGAGNVGGVAGVIGSSANSSGVGVLGTTASGYGVRGEATASNGYGVIGVAGSANGIGVIGSATGAATGVIGQASGTGRAAYFNQSNAGSSSPAVVISQSGTGLALDVTGGAIRTPEVNSTNTGTANMLPLAYGRIAANGTILSGSGNFSVSIPFAGTGYYEITLSAPSGTNLTNTVCVSSGTTADALNGQGVVMTTASGTTSGIVQVNTWLVANNGNLSQPNRAFSFVVYQP